MHIFYQPALADGITCLDEEESRHCLKVLRLKVQDAIAITDGAGRVFEAKIAGTSPRKVEFKVTRERRFPKKDYHIHLAIAATKNMDRMEWFVEKSVEIGIQEISFLYTANSERKKVNMDRLMRKAVSAMKQSQKAWLPVLHGMETLTGFFTDLPSDSEMFIAYVDKEHTLHLKEAARRGKSYVVLIGPEGDFNSLEIDLAREKGFVPVSLGESRLRTETAGLVACHILNLINDS